MVQVDSRTLAAFCGRKLLLVDSGNSAVLGEIGLPGHVGAAAATPAGDLAFAVEEAVYRISSAIIEGFRS
jgi:hypothetical protein